MMIVHPGMERFANKTAIVTGATSGIGEVIAERLAQEGARVVVCGRRGDIGQALAERLGGSFVEGDVRDPATAERAVLAADGLDVLVNNAGMDHTGDLLDVPPDEVREVFEVNLMGACWFLQAAGRAMSGSGGSIVNVTSRLASIGVPKMGIYAASKGALLALTRNAAVELAPNAIRVNAVAPGFTATPLYDTWLAEQSDPAAAEARVVGGIPQGRVGQSRDVAAAVAFLASDEAAHITGASLAVDGGYTAA
jgi:NAD(P)-dependent dehydrogenase (short-subunit alcohol dehydrogenase family)